ncbi:type I restriction-modification system subunit M N-terminal domain-containing protein [Avibacterium endocarditidis]|uniref:type I restriction-modification system subunit M N-terminal domain-containing protein n=1 Tax=Avibacterium endocarditidis TaxID=380674 RepID=UPI001FE376EA|nr:type I restriction-modification system subunit M N-terminal domain-containing protein [Avibacterium endocarditidis]
MRNQLSASDYKHIVLGLIFLKYISDSFTAHRKSFSPNYKIHKAHFILIRKSIPLKNIKPSLMKKWKIKITMRQKTSSGCRRKLVGKTANATIARCH